MGKKKKDQKERGNQEPDRRSTTLDAETLEQSEPQAVRVEPARSETDYAGTRKGASDLFLTNRTYAAPFGRYQAGGEVEPPADLVLVGREGQRAFFIDLLLRAGRRGAYLITGHRGVGKTSFVRYGLAEYEGEVFERFLRSNVGRSIFWDRLGIIALGLMILVLALVASEVMELLVLSASRDSEQGNLLLWFFAFIILVPCLYPLLFAREIVGEIIEASFSRARRERLNAAASTAAVLFLTVFCWFLGPFGAPVPSLSRILLILGALYLFCQATSFRDIAKDCQQDKGKAEALEPREIAWRVLAALFFLSVGVYIFAPHFLPNNGLIDPGKTASSEIGNLALALAFLGWGGFLYGIGVLYDLLLKGASQLAAAGIRSKQVKGVIEELISSELFWYVVPGLALALGSLGYLEAQGMRQAVKLAITTFMATSVLYLLLRRRGQVSRPRPIMILAAKALLCTVLTIQLAFPLLARISWPAELKVMSGASHATDEKPGAVKPARQKPANQGESLSTLHMEANSGELRTRIFPGKQEELEWVALVFIALGVVYFLEYEWIVRPFIRERNDPVIDPSTAGFPAGSRSPYRNLAKITLPWLLYKTWLPVITVAVNLGFERLDHRRVVQAMLTGLRTQYHRKFLAWNSSIANLGRIFRFFILASIVVWAGEKSFSLTELKVTSLPPHLNAKSYDWYSYQDVCRFLMDYEAGSAASLVCGVKYGSTLFRFLYFDVVGVEVGAGDVGTEFNLLRYLVPFSGKQWPSEDFLLRVASPDSSGPGVGARAFLKRGIHVRVYHIILLFVLIFLGRWLTRKLPVPAYRGVLRQIDEVIDSLISSTSTTSRVGRWQPIQWLEGLFLSEKVRETQQDPFDPRTVEFMFLNILEEMQEASVRLPGARNQILSLPVPEITFFFDELDKLGTRIEPVGEGEFVGNDQQREILHAERRRSLELHRLLADMKNLLSSAPARFIFVGGRNLHDEWLADQTARQPLLTNIFMAEIYLPSLLTDHSRREKGVFDENVKAYVKAQERRAAILFGRFQRKLALPSPALPVENGNRDRFVVREPDNQGDAAQNPVLYIICPELGDIHERRFVGEKELNRDFMEFLTYRSLGNPKRLKELLASFVRPVGRVVKNQAVRSASFRCDHVLSFDETDRFRIQLLAALYRNLRSTFEVGFANRDDKLTVTMFHLADFLLKFHRRAFSWTNLERVEDLVHIHRAPDLREVLETIVEHWSERFLHRIRNGMYDFRFRSAFALELEHISRQSPEEMAAFNFTLDESQALKSVYETSIRRLKEEKGQELQDIVAGLGELHEFDQEYDTSRFYYRRAIVLLDTELREITGGSLVFEKTSPMMQIIKADEVGEETARHFMSWGIARLRLMLQIGMTFELARNFERAEVEYQNARSLSRSLLLSMLNNKYSFNEGATEASPQEANLRPEGRRLHALKHLNLIFQPVFAEVWLAEKFGAGVDTSVGLVEKELSELRDLLPFVRDRYPGLSEGAVQRRHANFSLIAAELHDKAGDLYFFKGRQTVRFEYLDEMKKRASASGSDREVLEERPDGYLLRAHYHYSVALHELRRFTTYRKRSSGYKWNLWRRDEVASDLTKRVRTWETISTESWPDFVYRSAGGTFSDIAEAMLGRVSLYGLFTHLSQRELGVADGEGYVTGEDEDVLVKACTEWMESAEIERTETERALRRKNWELFIPLGAEKLLPAGTLRGWLGEWSMDNQKGPFAPTIEFQERESHGDVARLTVGLNFMRVGAKYLEKGGYIEEAARESLMAAEAVTSYLWWSLAIQWVLNRNPPQSADQGKWKRIRDLHLGYQSAGAKSAYWSYLFNIGCYSLRKADRLFKQGRRVEKEGGYLVVDKVPANAVTLACSLGLVAGLHGIKDSAAEGNRLAGLRGLLEGWRGAEEDAVQESEDVFFQRVLRDSLIRHSFPVINRLHGLKVLIDTKVISDKDGASKGEVERLTQELLDLANKVNAPLHFTPLQSGTTCALVYLRYQEVWGSNDNESRSKIKSTAQRDLLASEQMSTMRRAFYENVSGLFYLYDDFNDRQLHFNHAMQMAGLEYVSVLRALVKYSERLEDKRPVFIKRPSIREVKKSSRDD